MTVRVALVGWNGKMNAGDDAMSAAFVRALRETAPTARIFAYADHDALPAELASQGVTGIRHFNQATHMRGLRRVLLPRAMAPWFARRARADLVIVGGGSILTERWNIAHLLEVVRRARKSNPGARVIGVSVSLGPFEDPDAERLCAILLSECDAVAVRDTRSMAVAARLCPALPVFHYPDAALAFCHDAVSGVGKARGGKRTIGVALRSKADEARQGEIVGWLAGLDPSLFDLKFLCLSSYPRYDDAGFARSFLADLAHLDPVVIPYSGTLRDLLMAFAGCDLVLAVRLHAMIFASALGKPVVFHPYHRKLVDFAEDVASGSIQALPEEFLALDPSVLLGKDFPDEHEKIGRVIEGSAMNARLIAGELARIEARGHGSR